MKKPLIIGQQVKVQLLEDIGINPLVIDFDSIDYDMNIRSGSYKTIGKSITTKHNEFEGYTITLSRNKRDNYLDALLLQIAEFKKNRQRNIDLTLELYFNHTYSVNEINPSKEFQKTESSFLDTLTDGVISATQEMAIRETQSKSGLATKMMNNISNSLSSAYDVSRHLANQGYMGVILNNFLNKEGFEEKYVFTDCQISKFSSSIKPNEYNTQQLILESSFCFNVSKDIDSYRKYIANILLENNNLRNNLDYETSKLRNVVRGNNY